MLRWAIAYNRGTACPSLLVVSKVNKFLWILCVCVPGLCVWGGDFFFLSWLGKNWDKLIISVDERVAASVLLALPFALLALLWDRLSDSEKLLQRVRFANAATLGCLMAFGMRTVFYVGYHAVLKSGGAGGNPVALGFLVLTSPVMVWIGMWVGLRFFRK